MSAFDTLLAEVMSDAGRFGHREHTHLAWLAVRRYGSAHAVDLVSDGIRRAATAAGTPEKYHATMTRAWVALVAHHAAECENDGFDAFVGANPALLDKDLLRRFYRSATLAGSRARDGWVEPDRAPFPWTDRSGMDGAGPPGDVGPVP